MLTKHENILRLNLMQLKNKKENCLQYSLTCIFIPSYCYAYQKDRVKRMCFYFTICKPNRKKLKFKIALVYFMLCYNSECGGNDRIIWLDWLPTTTTKSVTLTK